MTLPRKRRILDVFACAGHYGDGLTAAGWLVYAIDNDHCALRHNPYPQFHGDALDALHWLLAGLALPFTNPDTGALEWLTLADFDAIHASPPCQIHSATRQLAKAQGRGQGRAINLIPQTQMLLEATGLPWVIENVNRSPLRYDPSHIRLCGSHFGLDVERHRLFIAGGFQLRGTPCDHSTFPLDPKTGKPRPWGVYHAKGDTIPAGGRTVATLDDGMRVMGITRRTPWKYLCEALPPAYGLWLGQQMMSQVESPVPVGRQLTMF